MSDFPLSCGSFLETASDTLEILVQELRLAKRTGEHMGRAVEEYQIPKNQFGVLAIALSRILETAEYRDRQEWIDEFKSIKNGVDASLFLAEAKLKVIHGIDVKRIARQAATELRNRHRVLNRLNLK
jgi:phospholipase C